MRPAGQVADASGRVADGEVIRVREIGGEALSAGKWDTFVHEAEGATICHLAGWSKVMTGVLGQECRYAVAEDDAGDWRGILPLVLVRGMLGHFLVSMPFLNDGGPLGDPVARERLVQHAVNEAQRSHATLLELRSRTPLAGPVATSNRKISVHLSLPESVEALWDRTFRAKLRSQVRRPTKEGMRAAIGMAQLEPFYEVFAHNMHDLGTPVLPRAFFERIATTFPDKVMFTAVYTAAGQPVAAACCLLWRGEMEVTWASSMREHNKAAPNMLLYARLMEEAISRGIRVFNFGRCSPGAATHRFKLQWGGADVPLPWAFWSRDGVVGTPSPERPLFRLATAAWRHLPLSMANRLGPALARQLP